MILITLQVPKEILNTAVDWNPMAVFTEWPPHSIMEIIQNQRVHFSDDID